MTLSDILACMSMIFLRGNDPFHFGTMPRALLSVVRMETLDSWDTILHIALYGCDEVGTHVVSFQVCSSN